MNDIIERILTKIYQLQDELEEELHSRAEELRYKIHDGTVVFEREVLAQHRQLKIGLLRYIREAPIMFILTAPIIYSLIIPFVLMDLFVTVYQSICFPLYGIPKAKRGDYFIFDRVRLSYLNGIEKINCLYCSYGNGVAAYTLEVAARTEQYWCPIKHAESMLGHHSRYHLFTDFGDGQQYRDSFSQVRNKFDDL